VFVSADASWRVGEMFEDVRYDTLSLFNSLRAQIIVSHAGIVQYFDFSSTTLLWMEVLVRIRIRLSSDPDPFKLMQIRGFENDQKL
jgi:hypothetical protein